MFKIFLSGPFWVCPEVLSHLSTYQISMSHLSFPTESTTGYPERNKSVVPKARHCGQVPFIGQLDPAKHKKCAGWAETIYLQ